jgi:predicted transcriptional regulator
LRNFVAREVGRDPRFSEKTLTSAELDGIARVAIAKFYDARQAAFREQHAGLAQFAAAGLAVTPREDPRSFFAELTAKLSPGMASGHPLSTEPRSPSLSRSTTLPRAVSARTSTWMSTWT